MLIDFSVNGLVIDFGRPVLESQTGCFFSDALFAAKGALDRDEPFFRERKSLTVTSALFTALGKENLNFIRRFVIPSSANGVSHPPQASSSAGASSSVSAGVSSATGASPMSCTTTFSHPALPAVFRKYSCSVE